MDKENMKELELDVDSAEDTEYEEVTEEVELSEDDAEEAADEPEEDTDSELELGEEQAEELEPELTIDSGEELEPELESEAGEELEEEEELTEEEKAEKRQKRNRILKRVGLSVLGVLLVVYFGFAFYFNSHFYFNTTINGRNYSLNSVSQVEKHTEALVGQYNLTLKRSDGTVEIIDGEEINLAYEKGDTLSKLKKTQNPFLWPVSLFEKQELESAVGVSYDETKLQEQIAALSCMQEESQVAPVSAMPEFDGTEFVVKEEVIGSQIIPETFNERVRIALDEFRDELDMVEEDCYVRAVFLKDDPAVAEACDVMNSYLGAQITYTFGSQQEVVDSAKISTWLTTDENMQVTFQTESVSAYIAELAAKYDTYKTERTFTAGNGNTVTVTGGSYGWQIDQVSEYAALIANIENKEVITKEPVYSRTAATHDGPDWGSSYVEVDLSNQRVYLFVNGALVDSASCVTGCVAEGHSTPQGVYSIAYCQRGATLRGPKQPDGTYEWESPVRYWMPFNGGIGLHDADWRGSFGGTIYKYNGSHGCVNLPIPFAKTVFETVSAGTPVICHY